MAPSIRAGRLWSLDPLSTARRLSYFLLERLRYQPSSKLSKEHDKRVRVTYYLNFNYSYAYNYIYYKYGTISDAAFVEDMLEFSGTIINLPYE